MTSDDPEGPAGALVLLVEDDVVNRTLALRQLERLGYGVRSAIDGDDAVAATAATRFGAILMDCQLPGMDGFQATREIRRREAGSDGHVPIIAMTAQANAHDREACLAAGMDDYLSKPVMLEALSAVLGRWLAPTRVPKANAARGGEDAVCPSTPPAPGVDPAAASRLRDELGAGAAANFVAIYLRELPGRIESIERAIADGDGDSLRTVAHTLKSSSASVGATALGELCVALERDGREGRISAARGRLTALRTEVGLVIEAPARVQDPPTNA